MLIRFDDLPMILFVRRVIDMRKNLTRAFNCQTNAFDYRQRVSLY